MKEIPRISDAEWEVMKVFWSASPRSANEVIDALSVHRNWNDKTVKSLLSRLVKKKALGYNQKGRMYYYHPLVSEEECIKVESKSFIERVFGGALQPALVHFIKEQKLTPEEVEELKKILDKGDQ
ncbi:BlaI/MecI/CopY family transcriptional regulator [Aneurinibacillus sp. BA2021]|nr:BlaI/MecI/CopY family transcriptional regulator [Aneurinibacillus sp. BA2021]